MVFPIIADLSHHNWDKGLPIDFGAAAASGTVGIIFKASQGGGYSDPTYGKSRRLARDAGLLWGAYHFGTDAAVDRQVENFLRSADPDDETLLVLDFERNEPDPTATITLEIATEFLHALEGRTGRRPTVYTGPFMYDQFGRNTVAELATYRVWWARYSENTDLHPTWQSYFLWQYSDGHSGPKPHKIDGLGFCDCNHFDGTAENLASRWIS